MFFTTSCSNFSFARSLVAGTTLLTTSVFGATLEIAIEGLDGPLLDNARAYLSIEQNRDLPDLTELRVRLLHERAADEIAQALRPFGTIVPA